MKKALGLIIILIMGTTAFTLISSMYLYQNPFYFIKDTVRIDRIQLVSDKDGDGKSDLDDILEGARKEIRNHPKYRSEYYEGGYPPENEGVCTDVVWRALKNTGYDLKKLIDEDIQENVKQYPWVEGKPDPNIDFRRVRNQLVFFRKYAHNLTTEVIPYDKINLEQWQAGDIVVLEKTDHIAIVSDKRRRDGVPYIIHNSSTYPKEENKLMKWYKSKRIVAHFRFPKTEFNMDSRTEIDSALSNDTIKNNEAEISNINKSGKTISERFILPEGFERTVAQSGSFEYYLRNLNLKPHGEKVRFYNGQEKSNEVYAAVVDMDIGNKDLQQCADAVMRLRGEYLYAAKLYDKIHFNFTSGFRADFSKWINGYRIAVKGNKASWIRKTSYSDSYENFRSYMDFVFAYAGTLSLEKELQKVPIDEMKIGDVFIRGGSPGHCVIVVDMAENKSTGSKIFMLAQSYMPAQNIQILKNSQNDKLSPWYSTEIKGNLETPEWTFPVDALRRFPE